MIEQKEMNKKGQLAIFIIIAVVIVGAVIIFFTMTDSGKRVIDIVTNAEYSPNQELQNCLENNKEIDNKINAILEIGGSKNKNYFSKK